MADKTAIEWTDATFNPWVGCTPVSAACDFCYAESWAKRSGHPELWNGERRRTSVDNWRQPIKWNRKAASDGVRKRVFCASLADVFDNQVPTRWRHDLWHLIDQTPHLDWQLLTKRPQNIVKMLPNPETGVKPWGRGWPNVWLGTTTESQDEANRRIPPLLKVDAAIHFSSAEPLLGEIDFEAMPFPDGDARHRWSALTGQALMFGTGTNGNPDMTIRINKPIRNKLALVIVGGESGAHARPMHPSWARSIRDQCQRAGVPFFYKQTGEWSPVAVEGIGGNERKPSQMLREPYPVEMIRVGKKRAGRLFDGKLYDGMPLSAAS